MKTEQKLTVGLVMKSLQADFFKDMQQGAETYAAQQNRFKLISAGTNSQTEIEQQIAIVNQLVEQNVDAIVVVPIDSKALVPPVVQAIKKGITVVNIDIRLDEQMLQSEGIDLTYVGPDNFTASQTVGKELSKLLDKGDKVFLIEGLPVAENAQQRKAGFESAISEAGLYLAESVPANWETDTAEEIFATLYKKHPDVKGVFCCNDAMALGVIKALKSQGVKPGMIPVVGFDNDVAMQPYLSEGWLLATIDAYGSQMAVEGIRYAMQIIDGLPSGGIHKTPFTLIKRK